MNKTDKVLHAICELANKLLPTGAYMTLFGSRARGDVHADSDWDLLIVVDRDSISLDESGEYVYAIRQLGWSLDEDINPVVYTSREWAKRSFTPFYKNVERDGIRIWG